MKKHLLATLAVSTVLLSGCGKETIIKEVLVTAAPTTTEATLPQEPPKTKFDSYLEDVYSFSAQARTWDESDLLEFGTIVCEAFTAGSSLNEIIAVLEKYSSGAYDDELFAAVIMSSVENLCPQHRPYVESQL